MPTLVGAYPQTKIFLVWPRTILNVVSGLVGWSVGWSQHKFQNKQLLVPKRRGMDYDIMKNYVMTHDVMSY